MNEGKVTIGNINNGTVTDGYCYSLLNFCNYDSHEKHIVGNVVPWRGSGLNDINRNYVVDIYMQLGDEFLFFVDSDITLLPTTCYELMALCSEEKPVVSGIYTTYGPSGKLIPVIYHLGYNEKGEYTMLPHQGRLPADDLMEIDGCGAGCLMIHRSILEKMQSNYPPNKAWFDTGIYYNVAYGEDHTFCMRVKEMGYQVYAAPNIQVPHEKSGNLVLPEEYRGTSS